MQTQAIDDPALDDDVTAHRERAKDLLNEIARQTKQALTEQGIDTSVFFLIPHTGDAIVTFGTTLDPDDALWSRSQRGCLRRRAAVGRAGRHAMSRGDVRDYARSSLA